MLWLTPCSFGARILIACTFFTLDYSTERKKKRFNAITSPIFLWYSSDCSYGIHLCTDVFPPEPRQQQLTRLL